MAQAERIYTEADLDELNAEGIRYELEQGRLVEMPSAKPRHFQQAMRLGAAIDSYLIDHDLGEVSIEWGCKLPPDGTTLRFPDVAYASFKRFPNIDLDEYLPGAPDLAVEIVSPTDTYSDVRNKTIAYFEAGTLVVWVIERYEKLTYVYEGSVDNRRVVEFDEDLDCSTLLPGFTVNLARLFAGLKPSESKQEGGK